MTGKIRRHTLRCAMPTNIVQVEGRAQLLWKVARASGGHWVAVCDPMGLTIQSDTWASLMEDIAQTLNALMVDLLEEGELDRFLRDRGFTLVGSVTRPGDTWFDVPFSATRTTDRDLEAALH